LTAFVHTSYAADQKDHLIDNQRLEFLGDAILGAVVSQLLYARFTTQPESKLTLYKIYLVKEQTLAQAARAIGL
jgi:ribonuclease-3